MGVTKTFTQAYDCEKDLQREDNSWHWVVPETQELTEENLIDILVDSYLVNHQSPDCYLKLFSLLNFVASNSDLKIDVQTANKLIKSLERFGYHQYPRDGYLVKMGKLCFEVDLGSYSERLKDQDFNYTHSCKDEHCKCKA